jgi:hypothetical protein
MPFGPGEGRVADSFLLEKSFLGVGFAGRGVETGSLSSSS